MSAYRGLVAGALSAGVLAAAGACPGGLMVDAGNAFPCDYTQAEEVRDTACSPGWRCGIDSQCHEDAPESLELGTAPVLAGAERLFPQVLDGEASFVALDAYGRRLLVGQGDGVVAANRISARPVSTALPVKGAAFAGARVALVTPRVGGTGNQLRSGTLESGAGGLTAGEPLSGTEGVRALRSATLADGGTSLLVLRSGYAAGEVDLAAGRYTSFPGSLAVQVDGGVCGPLGLPTLCPDGTVAQVATYLDARPVAASALVLPARPRDGGTAEPDTLVPVAVTPELFLWREPGGSPGRESWQVLNPDDPVVRDGLAVKGPPEEDWLLRHTEGASLWALRRPVSTQDGLRHVLSTWVLRRTQQGPRMERAWDDCAPCAIGRLVSFTPVSDGALGVEVLCESARGTRALFRVVGASVASPLDTCLRQPLEAPVDLSEVASEVKDSARKVKAEAVDESLGAALALGGAHGQLWAGPTLSTLRPLFLDRAPKEVAGFEERFLTLSPDFFALELLEPVGPGESRGLTVVGPAEVDGGTQEATGLETLVKGVPGWLVLEAGQLVRVEGAGTVLGSRYGPQLLAPSGEPATGPFLGEGHRSGTEVSLVLTANDQLYSLDSARLEAEPGQQDGLLPRLTPDPGFPVRSLARDRTVKLSATTGLRVRGWLCTGRSLFEYQQSAEGGWSLVPLPLGAGEPVEVWSLEGQDASYGRVGLRDGQVLRLPAGLPLTRPLPVTDRVVDYASLNGWPVALGEKGLYFAARREDRQEGLLAWVKVALPAGGLTEDGLTGARIEVVPAAGSQALLLFTRTGFVYRLRQAAR